jgi:esterase/lipase superfamily enzyme
MFVVTNRNIVEGAGGLEQLGARPNEQGPNELRLFEATKSSGSWEIKIVPDQLDDQMKREIGITGPEVVYGSTYAARKIIKSVQKNNRHILFFVHGFNNNLEAVLDRSLGFEETFKVEVIPFSWPANGGGVKSALDYLSDKRDARASVGALDRALAKVKGFLDEFNKESMNKIIEKAMQKFPDNPEARDQYISKEAEDFCPFTVNMVLHSMGNYLYKNVLQSSAYRGDSLIFDNVVLVAADANNKDHAEWVDRIQCRKRIYITINEDDAALLASRLKSGEEQLPRLGHYPYDLNAKRAVYVDFTGTSYVTRSHSYFEGGPLRNKGVRQFFEQAFKGERAEGDLRFDPASGTHRIK